MEAIATTRPIIALTFDAGSTNAGITSILNTLAANGLKGTLFSTRPLFRFPFGDRDSRTIAAVNANGYVCVRWTVDTLGWKGTLKGGITAQIIVDRVLAGAHPGAIMMMHVGANPDDGTTLDADALPTVISQLRARGYGFVTLDALLT